MLRPERRQIVAVIAHRKQEVHGKFVESVSAFMALLFALLNGIS